jgi:hypothetical protein
MRKSQEPTNVAQLERPELAVEAPAIEPLLNLFWRKPAAVPECLHKLLLLR